MTQHLRHHYRCRFDGSVLLPDEMAASGNGAAMQARDKRVHQVNQIIPASSNAAKRVPPMNAKLITIIGAGIGGLTAALALQRRGFKVQVFERSKEIREIGAGITISPQCSPRFTRSRDRSSARSVFQ